MHGARKPPGPITFIRLTIAEIKQFSVMSDTYFQLGPRSEEVWDQNIFDPQFFGGQNIVFAPNLFSGPNFRFINFLILQAKLFKFDKKVYIDK